jgi:alpha-tubulin suppressor-like RCC1 family protein
MQDGSLLAFGQNGSNRTGFIGNNGHLLSPQVVFSGGVQAVAGHDAHSLFLKTDGSLWSTGANLFSRVGAGEWAASVQPTKIVESEVAGISAGQYHSIYWMTNGEVYVFGSNREGQLGLPGRTFFTHEKQVLYDPNQ